MQKKKNSCCPQQVEGKLLDRSARSVKLGRLNPATRYLVCVLGLGQWVQPPPAISNTSELMPQSLPQLTDSQTSRCTEVWSLLFNFQDYSLQLVNNWV